MESQKFGNAGYGGGILGLPVKEFLDETMGSKEMDKDKLGLSVPGSSARVRQLPKRWRKTEPEPPPPPPPPTAYDLQPKGPYVPADTDLKMTDNPMFAALGMEPPKPAQRSPHPEARPAPPQDEAQSELYEQVRTSDPGTLRAGTRVQLTGLKNRPDMVGLTGTLVEEKEPGKWQVLLDEGLGSKLLKTEFLQSLDFVAAIDQASINAVPPYQYSIAGTWDDWMPHDMNWDFDMQIFQFNVPIGSSGTESFTLCKGKAGSKPLKCKKKDYTIVVDKDDSGVTGVYYKVKLHIEGGGKKQKVEWQKHSPKSAEQEVAPKPTVQTVLTPLVPLIEAAKAAPPTPDVHIPKNPTFGLGGLAGAFTPTGPACWAAAAPAQTPPPSTNKVVEPPKVPATPFPAGRSWAQLLLEHGEVDTKRVLENIKQRVLDGEKRNLLETVDQDGFTSLHYFAGVGEPEIVAAVLDLGSNVDLCGPKRATALHYAVAGGHAETAALLLSSEAMVDARDIHGNTPLMCAQGHACVDVLLEHGADAHARNLAGQTALIRMAAVGDVNAIQALGRVRDLDLDAQDKNGHTASTIAMGNQQGQVDGVLKGIRANQRSTDVPVPAVSLDDNNRLVINMGTSWAAHHSLAADSVLASDDDDEDDVFAADKVGSAESTTTSDGEGVEATTSSSEE
eukprot:gnl/TRDRNA2_/TRDRNA2_167348_c4_seq3.p1 gnl/TRDRNA2_/TRDRNA2_167348_c4~~gnl/TRDRNA2_/TRDRNA2_167348_c4_seq3.p1  ORF type:complete len:759 (-),score=172.10 gnl/TRDRNA2_/TRDRNA2_167348_c4_seq3:120-2141(-)